MRKAQPPIEIDLIGRAAATEELSLTAVAATFRLNYGLAGFESFVASMKRSDRHCRIAQWTGHHARRRVSIIICCYPKHCVPDL